MRVGQLEVLPGEKKRGVLPIGASGYELPVTVICGGEGKTTLITGGIHNAEYVGIQAAIELGCELEPEQMDGTVIVVPLVNVSGFAHRTMSLVFEDGKNLNREFPGNPDGTLADQICHTIVKELFSAADYYIDLHCGDGFEELTPYVYYVGCVEKTVRETARRMAGCVNVPYVVESQCATGGAYNYANAVGIPSILLERGCRGVWSRAEVEQDKADVRRVLDLLYRGRAESFEQTVFRETVYEDAPCAGCWYPAFSAGAAFKKGEILGEIRDVFGTVLHTCRASAAGVILYQTASLSILKDSPMVAYGVTP